MLLHFYLPHSRDQTRPRTPSCPYLFPCKCMQRTVDVCPYSVCTHSPVSAFHTLSVRSVEPLMTMLSLIWEDHTPPVWPTSVCTHCKEQDARRWFGKG